MTRPKETTIAGPARDVPFGELLRQAATKLGVTQEELAKRLGVKQPRISEIFASESITEALLDRVIEALGAELEVRVVR